MEVIPAIDIKGGKCVRLYQGDYSKETIFSDDPVSVAAKWQAKGAARLHIVDLDGAVCGELCNITIIESMVKQVSLAVQLGGGIRDEFSVERLLDIGVQRVILGTVAIEQPELVERLCHRFSEAIVVGVDAREGYVATHGWLKGTTVTALELSRKMADSGVQRILYTDIKRDGTLTEPDFVAIAELVENVHLPIIAAGGISVLHHLKRLGEIGAEAAVVGKALYTGDIDLAEALAIS